MSDDQMLDPAQQQLAEMTAMLQETEDLLQRLQLVVAATTTGIAVLDQEQCLALLLNGDCAPCLRLGEPPPPELLEALQTFSNDGAIECEGFDVVQASRDAAGNLVGFAFFPQEAVAMAEAEAALSPLDELLGSQTEDLSTILDTITLHKQPNGR